MRKKRFKKENQMKQIIIKVPESLHAQLKNKAETEGYPTMSELVRAAIIQKIKE